ncbi:hypothetical protein [Asaia prunellae]|uniref:hypothetical protein n=1 Tax=Asaia prunellae TaxID=610245 RepID=UPI00046ECD41|nr:hypothetical protein [Asaia prunellae]
MTSKAESHAELAEAERLGAELGKWAAGLVPVPAALVGRGSIYDTAWLTPFEASLIAECVRSLLRLSPADGRL